MSKYLSILTDGTGAPSNFNDSIYLESEDTENTESDTESDTESNESVERESVTLDDPVYELDGNSDDLCCICLDTITTEKLPIRLSCKHTFCFLCLKGFHDQNPSCPLCRRLIPKSILENAKIKASQIKCEDFFPQRDGCGIWFYSGRNGGWWAYDPSTSKEIEAKYQEYQQNHSVGQENSSQFDLSLMGRTYVIDFVKMEQRNQMAKRKIKRETNVYSIGALSKGIAGLRLQS